ncbi:immunoglobulin-like domain-containing protein [Tamlana sp. I1]|uniref:immunoglobulin-like domain-containing protein n=1 Tax=Tamlana sp. I1 TaxID=2762061 RepID=UPI0018906E73|nr:immunoglobulin-like domain-containing protein [Tamlana sp. I1]
MKKIFIKILPLLLVALISCEQDDVTEGVSRITYYNDIEFVGDETMYVEEGGTFQDPGVIAFEGDEEVTEDVIVSGTVDTAKVGINYVTYSITNSDGFAKEITRTVIVYPDYAPSVDVSGTYTGIARGETLPAGCLITNVAPNTYLATDFFGGVYCCGIRNYGLAYRLKTYFYVSEDGTTYTAMSTDSPWGPWNILNPSITGTSLSHAVEQGGFSFAVQLIKE